MHTTKHYTVKLLSVAEVGFVRLGITEIFLCIDFDLEYDISNISEIKYAVPKIRIYVLANMENFNYR